MTAFTDLAALRAFVVAGDATFTVVGRQDRFTFRVRKAREADAAPWFVAVLTGPDNGADYRYLGTLFADGYRHGAKSKITPAAPSALAATWFFQHLADPRLLQKVQVYHMGRCGRCGRPLTVPESIVTGLGPICRGLT